MKYQRIFKSTILTTYQDGAWAAFRAIGRERSPAHMLVDVESDAYKAIVAEWESKKLSPASPAVAHVQSTPTIKIARKVFVPTVGESLTMSRVRLRLTPCWVAKRLGVPVATVIAIEQGAAIDAELVRHMQELYAGKLPAGDRGCTGDA